MAAPSIRVIGATAKGTSAITPVPNAGHAAGDVEYLIVESDNGATCTLTTAAGFVAMTGGQAVAGTGPSTSSATCTVFRRVWNGTDGNPTVADTGNHTSAYIVSVQDAATSGTIEEAVTTSTGTASTSGSAAGGTTTGPDRLVMIAVSAANPDADADPSSNFSGWTNAALTSLTEQKEYTLADGNGGAVALATGIKATAGAIGSTTFTLGSSAVKAMVTWAVLPATGPAALDRTASDTVSSSDALSRQTAQLQALFEMLHLKDTFSRTVSDGTWGFSDDGTRYHVSGESTHDFSVGSGIGTIVMNAVSLGAGAGHYLQDQTAGEPSARYDGSVSLVNSKTLVRFRMNKVPAGSNFDVAALVRAADTDTRLRVGATITTASAIKAYIAAEAAGSTPPIVSTPIAGLTFATATWYWIEAIVYGVSPTNIEVRVWQDGNARPDVASGSTSYATANAIQGPGGGGIRLEAGGSTTNLPITVDIDDFESQPLEVLPTQAGGKGRGAADTLTFSESAARLIAAARAATATATTSDAVGRAMAASRSASDTLSTTDSLLSSAVHVLVRAATDTTSLSDALARTANAARAPPDTTATSESVSRQSARARTATDATSTTESPARTQGFSRAIMDAGIYADTFDVPATNGWGTNWITSGGLVGNYSVVNGIASISQAAVNSARTALTGSQVDGRVRFRFRANAAAAGGSLFAYASIRRIDSSNYYRAVVEITTSGQMLLSLERIRLGGATVLQASTVAETYSVSTWFVIEAAIEGGDNPTIRARVYAEGSTPPAWQREEVDAGPVVSGAGSFGVRTTADAAFSGSLPVTFDFDDFALNNIGAAPSRSVAALRQSADTVITSDSIATVGTQSLNRAVTDTTALTEQLGRTLNAARAPPDTVVPLASVVGTVVAARTASDVTSLSEAVTGERRNPPQVVRPVADVSSDWHGEDGRTTNLYLSVADASDATYVESPDNPAAADTSEFGVGGASDPLVSGGHKVRYRYSADQPTTLVVELLQGTTVIAAWTHVNPSTVPTAAEQTLTGAQADAITNYADLRVRVRGV